MGKCVKGMLAAAKYMRDTSAMYSPVGMVQGKWIAVGATILAGLFLSLIPSLHAYRTNMACILR
ncbi:MAG: hypothetical protein Q4C61_14825 [Lachnospiraceae bacterium]|nr:hypothetical protein [Lachnospiraceae bacterium]